MLHGICGLSVIPMRAEASDASEMINQVLFGECFEILEQKPKWSFIQLQHDRYEGWVDNKQLIPISKEQFTNRQQTEAMFTNNLIDLVSNDMSGRFFPIFLGSYLPFFKADTAKLSLGESRFTFEGETTSGEKTRETMIEVAYKYLESPYLWGGRTPAGIDCSGFTQMVYRLCGYTLPRDSGQQASLGETLSFIEESQPGDLAFFDNEEGRITHVGLLLPNNYIIHASGMVRIDRLDQSGIFNAEIGKHTHRLRVIKKVM